MAKIKLTLGEMETVITFNKEEATATIYTYEATWQKIIEDGFGIKPTEDDGLGGRTYIIDKKRIRPPRPKRVMTDKQLKNLERARNRAVGPNEWD